MRVATFTGLVVSVVTLLLVFAYGVCRFTVGTDWPRGFATIVVLILGALGLNALFLGVIGEYLGRIYKQVKRGPLTVVETSIDRVHADASGQEDATSKGVREYIVT